MIVDVLRDGIIVERVIIMAIIFSQWLLYSETIVLISSDAFISQFHLDAIFQSGSAT